ncbi:MAG: hypothetical protein Roseis2KO_54230 [Roseivirga sp.]
MKYLQHTLIVLVLLCISCSREKPSVVLSFTGDVILARGVSDKLNIYGDTLLSERLKPLLDGSIATINLETVLTQDTVPVTGGYALRADTALARVLMWGGVGAAFIKNNHALDFGLRGLTSTQQYLEKAGIHGEEALSSRLGGKNLSLITASLVHIDDFEQSAEIDSLLNKVSASATRKADIPVLLYLHWGVEYQPEPTDAQRKLAYRLIDAGADAIIGHHPHVFQTIEFYKHKPIIYSLGNFVADAYLPGTTRGAIATIPLSDTLGHFRIKPVDLTDYFPREMSTKEEMAFFRQNLLFNDSVCFLKVDDQWQVREANGINFQEQAGTWLFSAGRGRMLSVRQLEEGRYKLSVFDGSGYQSSLALHGKLSQLMMADIDNDGRQELMLNIRKAVDFDKEPKNRLNIFDIDSDGSIKAQWLGTKFLRDLESFKVIKMNERNYLKTTETEAEASYQRIYEWDEFGFALSNMN